MDGYLPSRVHEYECVDSFHDTFAPTTAYVPDRKGRFTAEMFAEAAGRIQRSLRQHPAESPAAVAAMVVDTIEQASGVRISDQARLARQLMLWQGCCPPARAQELTRDALADRAGALRRSAAVRGAEGSTRK